MKKLIYSKEDLDLILTLELEEKEIEIERLNKENEELKKIQCTFLGTGCKAEIERLNNIIKRFEDDLREIYLTFGEFSEEYTEKKIKEIKGESSEED